jgi:hypothetical protein
MNNIKTFVVALVLVVVVLAVSTALSGCGTNPTESKVVEDEPSMFILVESNSLWHVVYHRETKVMYAVSDGYYNMGNFTVLVNADGTPMLYEEDE